MESCRGVVGGGDILFSLHISLSLKADVGVSVGFDVNVGVGMKFFSLPEPKAPGELIGWQPPSSSVVHTFKMQYLCSLLADLNRILSVACLW